MSIPRSTSLERGLVVLVALLLALGAMVPLASRMPVRAASPDLFISEYIEGSSNNKAIEIYNGTGATVSLSGYTLELYSNGSSAVTQTLAPSGNVADGAVYVIAHTLSNALIQAQADLLDDRHRQLQRQRRGRPEARRDGDRCLRPGRLRSPTASGVGTIPDTTQDHTLTRKPTVHAGDAIGSDAFVPSVEWDFHPQDTSSFLGSRHGERRSRQDDPTGVGAADHNNVGVGEQTVLTVDVTAGENPTSSGVTVTANLGPIDGDAAQAFADDGVGNDEEAGDLVFTFTATVGDVVAGDKVITARIEDGGPQRDGVDQPHRGGDAD